MKRVSILVIVLALIAGTVGCPSDSGPEPTIQYDLTISSSGGGSVTAPGEGTFAYDEGMVVDLTAEAEEGYRFVNWMGDVDTIANVNAAGTTISMNGDYEITANFEAIPPPRYTLTISSAAGGSVTAPGEGSFTYDESTMVDLVAEAEEGYVFVGWTGDVTGVVDIDAASTSITMNDGYTITASFARGIWDWHNLDAIRDNLGGDYRLMNNLDSTTAGYGELAGPAANGGKGWEPIGTFDTMFVGAFDGQGYVISGMFIDRRAESSVGLFGYIGEGASLKNLGLVSLEVNGGSHVGGLVADSWGTVSNCYSEGMVSGSHQVGGLVGCNVGTVVRCHSDASATGGWIVGGLVGYVGGSGGMIDCYVNGSVTGLLAGGLVGEVSRGSVSNCYYDLNQVLINGENVITIGALFGADFAEWLANNRFLDVNSRLSKEDGYYVISNVSDFKQLLAFGQDGSLRFRLENDLDLAAEPGLYIPYLAGEFDGNGHKISNLTFKSASISQVGLFGYLAQAGGIRNVRLENADLHGGRSVGGVVGNSNGDVSTCSSSGTVVGTVTAGGLVGSNYGSVMDCDSAASVTGDSIVGVLVGSNSGTMSECYSTGRAAGQASTGGLVGEVWRGSVSNCYYDLNQVLINGENVITIGALFGADFAEWLANNRFLDVNSRLSKEDGYYVISNVSDFKQLLAFGQDGSLRFRLENDLDLAAEPGLYIPYLAGEFDGNGHKISNLTFKSASISQVGLFGYLAQAGSIRNVRLENADLCGDRCVGGLVGRNLGAVGRSYSSGIVTGHMYVGGLVGFSLGGNIDTSCSAVTVTGGYCAGGLVGYSSEGPLTNSYATGGVKGTHYVGGLVGLNYDTVRNCYATGPASGDSCVGGLVGDSGGSVRDSVWDVVTSGQAVSSGGTGKTTAEMKSIATFADWDISPVAPGQRNTAYIWNIVDGQTYPFLSWQPVT